MEGDEAATAAHSLISFPEGRATFSILNYAFSSFFFSQDFSPLLYLVIFSSNLGPIYALSSIILPSASHQLTIIILQRLHMIFYIKYTGILHYKKPTSIQSGNVF